MTSDKKRKRDGASLPAGIIKVKSAEASDFPPVVASTVGVALPQLPLKPYTRRTATDGSNKRRARSEYFLHGSNPRLDYEACEQPEEADYYNYYVGIYDPATNSVQLHLAPKVHITSSIKAHRQHDLEVQDRGARKNHYEQRAELGKTFGTKKAQNMLTSREMNKVDATDMDASVSSAIVSQVEENTKDMPTTEELGQAMLEERPIPKYNLDARTVEGVYKREDLITEEDWESLWITDWVKNGTAETKSTHVNKRVAALMEDNSKRHTRELKILKYIASLIEFYVFQQNGRNRLPPLNKTRSAFYGTSPVVVEGFYRRFAEVRSDTQAKDKAERYTVSPRLESKLLHYLAVLCLMVDRYDVDLFDLKHDLNIMPRELAEAFKQVGCSIRELGKHQIEVMKITKAEAMQHKRAVLKVPLEFPPPPRRRMAKDKRR